MRTAKNYDVRLNEILDAAERLFITKGYEKTTVNDILDGVGISKGAFYYYFESKEQVMDAVITRMVDNAKGIAQTIVNKPELSAGQKLYQILTLYNSEVSNTADLVEELHHQGNSIMHQKSLVETILAMSPVLEEVVKQGIQEGVCNTPYPRESVEFLFTAAQFLLDPGLFHWAPQEILQKVKAFTYIMELVLGSPKGSYDWFLKIYEQTLGESLKDVQQQ